MKNQITELRISGVNKQILFGLDEGVTFEYYIDGKLIAGTSIMIPLVMERIEKKDDRFVLHRSIVVDIS